MDDNLAIFLILAISIWSAVGLVVVMAWIRRRPSAVGAADAGAARQVAQLTSDNELLRTRLVELEQRMGLLESVTLDLDETGSRTLQHN